MDKEESFILFRLTPELRFSALLVSSDLVGASFSSFATIPDTESVRSLFTQAPWACITKDDSDNVHFILPSSTSEIEQQAQINSDSALLAERLVIETALWLWNNWGGGEIRRIYCPVPPIFNLKLVV